MKGKIFGGIIGGIIGLLDSAYSSHVARIALRIRPHLADIGFGEAVFSRHFWDWLWIKTPFQASIFVISFFVVLGIVVGHFLES